MALRLGGPAWQSRILQHFCNMRTVVFLKVVSPEKGLSVANFLLGKKNRECLKLSKYPI